jgi:hypothetical protein
MATKPASSNNAITSDFASTSSPETKITRWPRLVGICAEDRGAEGVGGLDHVGTADEAGDTLA